MIHVIELRPSADLSRDPATGIFLINALRDPSPSALVPGLTRIHVARTQLKREGGTADAVMLSRVAEPHTNRPGPSGGCPRASPSHSPTNRYAVGAGLILIDVALQRLFPSGAAVKAFQT